jgi:D-amino peptidase
MKVYISVDMEGISGVVSWEEQAGPKGHDFDRFRKLMTGEANAAVQGALEAGADEVVVNDAHGGMKNLMLEELDPEARLISGSSKQMSMVEGLDESCDAVMFVGYHARAGYPGVLSHTYTGSVLEYRVNGRVFGELGMNSALAGAYAVPVVLVTGDSSAVEEADELLGELGPVQTVQVKRAVGRYAADNLHPKKARQKIRQAAQTAVERASSIEPLVVNQPVRVELRVSDPGLADGAQLMPEVERVDGLTVAYEAADYPTALRAARAMLSLGHRG